MSGTYVDRRGSVVADTKASESQKSSLKTCYMVESVGYDRVPSFTRSWQAEGQKIMNITPCSTCYCLAAMQRGNRHHLHQRNCCCSTTRGIVSRQPCSPQVLLLKLPSGQARSLRVSVTLNN